LLGERIEPLRRALPVAKRDEAMIAATAYPPVGYTDVELHYNQLDPFGWSWLADFLAVVCLALSFGVIRKPMSGWAGDSHGRQLLTCYGFALRTYVTGWGPGHRDVRDRGLRGPGRRHAGVWFTVLPLLRSGLRIAWLLSAAPGTWEAGTAVRESIAWERRHWPTSGWLCLAPRALLMYVIFTRLAMVPYGSGEAPCFISCHASASVPRSLP